MIDQKTPIEPPPTLDAILTHQGRIGRVDFSHRLVPDTDTAADTAGEAPGAASSSGAASAAAQDEPVRPVARIAPAPSVEDLVGDTDEQDDDRLGLDPPLPPEEDILLAPHPDLVEQDERGHEHRTEAAPRAQAPDQVRSRPVYPVDEPAPAPLPRREASTHVSSLLSLVPAEDAATVAEDIDDVVDGVIARMREVQHTTLAHLEATEIEAALRAEMLTAQAELDAELIRLHARREAHAIISAARQRAGLPQPPHAEEQRRRLDQLGEAAVRLAEELEALGTDPGSPDHPFRR